MMNKKNIGKMNVELNKFMSNIPLISCIVLILSVFWCYRISFFNNRMTLPDHVLKAPSKIQFIEWSSDLPKKLTQERKPMLIRNSPSSKWEAHRKWNPSFFMELFSSKDKTFSVKAASPPLFIHHDPSLELNPWFPPSFDSEEMTMDRFFYLINHDTEPKSKGYYVNDRIENISPTLLEDIQPIDPFLYYEPSSAYKNQKDKKKDTQINEPMIKLWMGGGRNGMIANTHYDATENFFTQIYGRKKFLLLPPSAWKYLYVYSRLHPSHRQSQTDLAQALNDTLNKFPRIKNISEAYEVILNPGDTLYLPPFWFHQVTTFNVSISTNIWTNSRELNDFHYALERSLDYISAFEEYGWIYDASTNSFSLQLFIRTLIQKFYPGTINEFIDIMIESQEFHLVEEYENIICGKDSLSFEEKENRKQYLNHHINDIRKEAFSRASSSIQIILLASLIENIASQYFSPEIVFSFLKHCISTKYSDNKQ